MVLNAMGKVAGLDFPGAFVQVRDGACDRSCQFEAQQHRDKLDGEEEHSCNQHQNKNKFGGVSKCAEKPAYHEGRSRCHNRQELVFFSVRKILVRHDNDPIDRYIPPAASWW
jgi:hypothetical protein